LTNFIIAMRQSLQTARNIGALPQFIGGCRQTRDWRGD
jgi:hypothetical protein